MSFYRTFFTALSACVIAGSVLADNTKPQTPINQVTPAVVKLNVNQVKAKDLANVKGLNPSLARSIVAYRKNHGEFKAIEDIVKVRALSKLNPADLKAIQDQLSVS